MPAVRSARGQSDGNLSVHLKILNTAGTPTVVNVSPLSVAGDISITDTGVGVYDLTIKNFQGPQSVVNVQVTPETIGNFACVTARSYSGADFSFTVKTGTAVTDYTAADTSSDVRLEAF